MSNTPTKVWTVLTMLEWATGYFEQKGVDSPRMSIEWLLADALNIRRLDLYLQYDRPLSSEELENLRPAIKRRARHEPLQHITGSTDFLGCTFNVNKHVLIPRPETEQLAELILDRFSDCSDESLSLLDIGTGSGCIPIAIGKKRPEWSCTGIDISPEALETARENARLNESDTFFMECDLHHAEETAGIGDRKWDIIVSNPPYIKPEERESLHLQVSRYEPDIALFHSDPVSLYEKIARFAQSHSGSLFLECSAPLAAEIFNRVHSILPGAELHKDYSGQNRFIVTSDIG